MSTQSVVCLGGRISRLHDFGPGDRWKFLFLFDGGSTWPSRSAAVRK